MVVHLRELNVSGTCTINWKSVSKYSESIVNVNNYFKKIMDISEKLVKSL
jgi:hypothetical protein